MARVEMDWNLKKLSSLDTVYSKNRQKFRMSGFLVKIYLKVSFWFVRNVVTCECKFQVSISRQLWPKKTQNCRDSAPLIQMGYRRVYYYRR